MIFKFSVLAVLGLQTMNTSLPYLNSVFFFYCSENSFRRLICHDRGDNYAIKE